MTHSNTREDLTAAWFASTGTARPKLGQKASFHFAPAELSVASNSQPFIKSIEKRLCHYRQPIGQSQKVNAEVYFIDTPLASEGITLPPTWSGIPLAQDIPARRANKRFAGGAGGRFFKTAPLQIIQTGTFHHLKLDHWEGLWRPNDLLVSFSASEPKTIKILIADAPSGASGGLRKKGPVDWEEIADLVPMLFMRLFNIFCLHAASVILDGKGIILTGASGSGKTTSALSLVQGGGVLLSDELTLIDTGGAEPVISGIILDPRLTHIGEDNIYAPAEPGQAKNNWEKISVSLPPGTVDQGLHKHVKPALILFMDLNENNGPGHTVHDMPEHEAVTQLVSQVLDPTNSTRHREIFEAVFQLATGCAIYRLEPGRNVEQLPAFIAGLL